MLNSILNLRTVFIASTLGLCWLGPWGASSIAQQQTTSPPASPAATTEAKTKTPKPEPRYCRTRRDAGGKPVALETSVIRFVDKAGKRPGVYVDLIGAVHIGEKRYYDELNRRFATYDAVLYELVAPEGTRVPQGGRASKDGGAVTTLQTGMKSMLELEFQLDRVDYTKRNLVHADLSPDEFAQNMKDRNDSVVQMMFRMMGHGLAMQARDPARSNDTQMLAAFFAKDRALQLRRAMAQQFESMEDQMGIFDGQDGSTIITERNKRALDVMARELAAGKKKLGIFYGAGHLCDMERKLVDDHGFQATTVEWLPAWPLAEGVKPR